MKYIALIISIIILSSCGVKYDITQDNTKINPNSDMKTEEINEKQEESSVLESPIEMQDNKNCIVYDDFSNIQNNNWMIVNDGVMGGKSYGNWEVGDSTVVFSGVINTVGGGFTSVRAGLSSGILSEYNTIKIRAKSDNRSYQITFRDNNRRGISHRAILPFENTGEIEEVFIDIDDLEPVFFGRRVNANPFDKENAREIGFIISDGVDGSFSIEIDSIEFCK